jgi:hypothetical protein
MKKKGFDSLSSKRNEEDKVIAISSEYFEDTRPSYICSTCNHTLIQRFGVVLAVWNMMLNLRMLEENPSYQYQIGT